MDYIKHLKKLGQGFLDLLFPVFCLVCGKENLYLCSTCQAGLPRLDKQQCLICQTPSPFGKTHPGCASKNKIDGIISALSYKDRNVKKIIEIFKYNFISDLNIPLSELLVEAIRKQNLTEYFGDFIMVPVPLHQKRLNWRGFNQAKILADELANVLRIGVQTGLVSRFKYTEPQVKLSQEERKKNMDKAFALNGLIAGKKILLIDDVVTTGSTLNEITKLLKQAGAAEVWGVTCAQG